MYRQHRRQLMKTLPDGLILLEGGREIPRNNDVYFPFRQNSNFLYLTGVEDPECLLMLEPKKKRSTLFIPKKDVSYRIWEGDVLDAAQAKKLYGVSRVLYSEDFSREARRALKPYRCVYGTRGASLNSIGLISPRIYLNLFLFKIDRKKIK